MRLISTSLVVIAFASVNTASAGSFGACPIFFVDGKPPVVKGEKLRDLCYSHFAVLHSGVTRTPVFTAEKLTAADIQDAKGEQRTNKFFADARLPSAERAELEDYEGSGYDRGHMAPAGDQPDETAMAQSFSLANMVPQAPHNNRGPWANYEKSLRRYVAKATGAVYVITGPVFPANPTKINGRVSVPTQLYKLVYDKDANRAWAYWTDNTDEAKAAKPISYAELVKRVGAELLPGKTPEQ